MKKQSAVWMVWMICLLALQAKAQHSRPIPVQRLSISDAKTTHLIFPYAIKSVDRGSQDVLVQKASNIENILQVKAVGPGLAATNLTVMTADGRLYSYLVQYSQDNPELNVVVTADASDDAQLVLFHPDATNDKVKAAAAKVIDKKALLNSCKVSSYNMTLSLDGVYAQGDQMFFQVRLSNGSSIDYPIRQLRIFLKDQKTGKRTTVQEIELEPVYILGNRTIVHHRSAHYLVIALPSLTIPDQKQLVLEVQETNGGRHLKLAIKNKHLVKASPIF